MCTANRPGSGAVGLDVPHGYGTKKVTAIAVVDRLKKLDARVRRVVAAREAVAPALAEARRRLGEWEEAESGLEASTGELRAQIAAALRGWRR